MRYIFCGGGTAGHITPAVAIADAIRETDTDASILFIGREGGGENRAITNAGYPLRTVNVKGLQRRLSAENLRRASLMFGAIRESRRMIREFSPDIVIGTGGYVSGPVLYAARREGIPTVIHESNSTPGLVSRICSRFSDLVLLNFKETEAHLARAKKKITVGNPIRKSFTDISRAEARKRLGIRENELYILSLGGSGGASAINKAAVAVMRSHSSRSAGIRHTHVCGERYYSEAVKDSGAVFERKTKCTLVPYLDDIHVHIAASDIVISRCGAMTLSEICAVGGAAILIPSPNVTGDHQYKNARVIYDGGGCILIEEHELSERVLLDALRELGNNVRRRTELTERARAFFIPDAAKRSASEVISLAKSHSATE